MRSVIAATIALGCSNVGVLAEECAPAPATSVSDERAEIAATPTERRHGPDMPYLRDGCSAVIHAAEDEPTEPPPDPADEAAPLYRRPTPLDQVSALRSPPRGTLAFLRNGAVWTAAADGTSRRKLSRAPWKEGDRGPSHGAPKWIFGGDELLFVTTQGEPRGRLVRFDRNCRYAAPVGARICSSDKDCFDPEDTKLSVSPDGTRVLYGGKERDTRPLLMLDLVTGTTRVVAPNHDEPAAWSRDGSRIAYRLPYPQNGIVVVDLVAGTRDVVTRPSLEYHNPVFGEDNNSLWFAATEGVDEFSVQTPVFRAFVPNDLSKHKPPPPVSLEHPRFVGGFFAHPWAKLVRSPDGSRLAIYESHRLGGLGALWTHNLDVLPTAPGGASFALGAGRSEPHHTANHAVFSDDGALVAYTMTYCTNARCNAGTRLIAMSDGATDVFVATGEAPDWTPNEGL